MPVPISQAWTVATYVLRQKLRGRRRYPLVLMLEPLFRCNLACAGCGKIQYPAHVLKMQLSPEECFGVVHNLVNARLISTWGTNIGWNKKDEVNLARRRVIGARVKRRAEDGRAYQHQHMSHREGTSKPTASRPAKCDYLLAT